MRKLTLLLATTLAVGVGAAAAAASTGAQPRLLVGGTLIGIGTNSVTVQIGQTTASTRALASKAVSFTVDANTRITLNGQVVPLSSLSTAMPVNVAFVPHRWLALLVEAKSAPVVSTPIPAAPPAQPKVQHEHRVVAPRPRPRIDRRIHHARRR